MLLWPEGPHLTYCSNIHPGESWEQTRTAVLKHVPAVREQVAPNARFGVGLRLSNVAVSELLRGDALATLRSELDARDLYVFTVNGFPYGPFHGTTVKERVYRPDWREPERERYTVRLADALEALLPPGLEGSISTVPGCFSGRAAPGWAPAVAEALRRQALDLWRRAQTRGVQIALALEPEPCCALETIAQTVEFFRTQLFCRASAQRFATLTGLSPADAEAALRRHIGVCLDTCHAAVEFEDPRACVSALLREGIRIPKVQVTTGLQITNINATHARSLRSFADDVYLHQVVARGPGGRLTRYTDLPEALRAFDAGQAPTAQWRVHFHVPVFMHKLGALHNTQPFLTAALHEVIAQEATQHLELETYTWGVLPPEHRTQSLTDAISAELQWVRSTLRAPC